MLCEYIVFYCVYVERERAIHPSQRRKKNEHRQLLFKPKQRSILNKPTKKKKDTSQTIYSTHIHRPVWNEKDNYRQTYRSKLQ